MDACNSLSDRRNKWDIDWLKSNDVNPFVLGQCRQKSKHYVNEIMPLSMEWFGYLKREETDCEGLSKKNVPNLFFRKHNTSFSSLAKVPFQRVFDFNPN